MKTRQKALVGTVIGVGLLAAITALVARHKRMLEARGHVPIGKSLEDRQLDWGGWPGGLRI